MNFRSAIFSFFTLFILLIPGVSQAQAYRIEIEIDGLSSDTIILGEYFTTRMVPKDTLVLDKKGYGVFEGEEAFDGGLYLIYINPDSYFDFLLGDDQELFIRAEMAQLQESLRFEGSEDNQVFREYTSFLKTRREELGSYQNSLTANSTKEDTARVQEKTRQLNNEMEAYMDEIEEKHPGLFAAEFIGATREPVPPAEFLTGDRRHDDSLKYFYYREHYLDRFDPHNIRLLHTPLYENKILTYLNRVVIQHPDSLIVAVDYLLEGSKENTELYRYMLITLFNHFAESKFMGMDAVYFHIAEYYYIPDADWSSKEFVSKLKENLAKNKPTLIGQVAPDLVLREVSSDHFHLAAQDTTIKKDPHIGHDFKMHDVDAAYSIIYFWEGDCGHCKKSTPALYEVFKRLRDKDVEVMSVHVINTIEGKELWVDFINDHGLYDWINCWSPYSNDFRMLYNLQSYPQLFVLDREKKIVAKKVSPEQAEQIINNLIAIEEKK